jgi:hypothetical protein
MPTTLSKELRRLLASVTQDAREAATKAARAALENLAVHEKDFRRHMTLEQRQLRNRLRARGRALGDERDERTGVQAIGHLTEDIAYEHWHRLLFTRFLTENHLLHTDERHGSVPVTLQDCEELAADEGVADGFELACRFASLTLPGVFRPNDPVLDLTLAQNDQVELRRLLSLLPTDVFTSDDALGWTYQFWQAKRKDEVNASGKKIGADELPAVTQLFTEDYMVEFLLHNTLGAWWAGKRGPIEATTEAEARAKAALPVRDGLSTEWTYLRLVQDEGTRKWLPAAGTFDGWPTAAKEVTFLDPCMGSGHFPAFVLPILARMRMEEESLPARRAVAAVLRDNLHGLELDPRCAQIGAFNIALTAWKLAGYQALPPLRVACSGLAPNTREADWLAIARGNQKLQRGMERVYRLFQKAAVLGSLINPRAGGGDLLEAAFHELQPLLEKALAQEGRDDAAHEMAVTARGLAKAAEILAAQFTLVATNVPYLGRGKQEARIREHCERVYPESKADLATCFVERSLEFCHVGGSVALVTPQNWLFLGTYGKLRNRLLKELRWNSVSRLGAKAFQTPMWDFNVMLLGVTRSCPSIANSFLGLEAGGQASPEEKAFELVLGRMWRVPQADQLANASATILFEQSTTKSLLSSFVSVHYGSKPGQTARVTRSFWDVDRISPSHWMPMESTPAGNGGYSGKSEICYSLDRIESEGIREFGIRGADAWGKRGFLLSKMASLPMTIYCGQFFDDNTYVVIPNREEHRSAIYAFLGGKGYREEVRKRNQKLAIDTEAMIAVPFDLAYWQTVAANQYPLGLPKPSSSDPTQWLFSGHPAGADQVLHVAVARLMGYQWPRQTGSSFADCPALAPDGLEDLADADGIVCLSHVNREKTAPQRLRELLAKALGSFDERTLLTTAGSKGSKSSSLEAWLRDEFFQQHCELFKNRPFVWHVSDGRKDGFHALVNCHRLDHANLQKLTYTYLGDWIRQQEEEVKADKAGADLRLGAARELQRKLANILEGEAPYDIFVRWKPMSEQAIGWHPDLNDGVRLNIRPFVEAGVLRGRVNVKWDKDRGKESVRDKAEFPWFWCDAEPDVDPKPGHQFVGHRWNNLHLTLAAKRAARGKA